MRIAIVSTLLDSIPPQRESSVESTVSLLTEGLVDKGHQVTLFATADSNTRAELRSPVAQSYMRDSGKWDWQLYEAYQVREAFRSWRDFNVINCHSYYHGLMFSEIAPISSLHSFHIEPGPDYLFLAERSPRAHLHFCSQYQRRHFINSPRIHVVPHGIDVNAYHVTTHRPKFDYLAWIGRFIPGKGPLQAIRVALEAGIPLKMAGAQNDYFKEVIEKEIDGRFIQYVGELHGRDKADFLANAYALLYPVKYGEPFGLVLVEAMASGTPIVGFNAGAVPEIVAHGQTGWIGESIQDLLRGLESVESLDRAAIRQYAVENYSSQIMIDRMDALLREIVESES